MKRLFRLIVRLKWFEDAMFERMNEKAKEESKEEVTQEAPFLFTFYTEVIAIDPIDGQLKKWEGVIIEANSEKEAQVIINDNGFGYCRISKTKINYSDFVLDSEKPSLN